LVRAGLVATHWIDVSEVSVIHATEIPQPAAYLANWTNI
jgi:hypothetical protein